MQHKPVILIILDGWGYRENPDHNAIMKAKTPNWDDWWTRYPHTLISGSGTEVGLPKGQMGNSEVGHIHMGVGRRVPQDFVRINDDIQNGKFNTNPVLNHAVDQVIKHNSQLHIIGLLSPGGVHSHENHIEAMIKLANDRGIKSVCLHAILDGRDTPPRSALASLAKMENLFKETHCGRIASIIGRYYAMDRDNRWDRIQCAYDLYTQGKAPYSAPSAAKALQEAYDRNESDEFVQATTITQNHQSLTIKDNDVVIFMNFRADRARQLTHALTDPNFDHFNRMFKPNLSDFASLTRYAKNINVHVAYPPLTHKNSLGEILANHNLRQLRIAETEKYAHVTFFFNGGREKPFENEDRILVPSPKVETYDLKPEMSAYLLTDKLIEAINSRKYDAVICNFANPDMVGHTGNFETTIKACEVIDECLGKIISALQSVGGEALITADHGNAELMYDESTGQPHTAHTTSPVPVLYIGRNAKPTKNNGNLADIAPTLCTIIDIPIPQEMTGQTLFEFQRKSDV